MVVVSVYSPKGVMKINVVIDTAAVSIWMDKNLYIKLGGEILKETLKAMDLEGRILDVSGIGSVSIGIWGLKQETQRICMLGNLSSGLIIGRKVWRKYRLLLDLQKMQGRIFYKGTAFSGSVESKKRGKEYAQEIFEDDELDDAILNQEMDNMQGSNEEK